MKFLAATALATSIIFLAGGPAKAADCAADNVTRVATDDECLVIKVFGQPAKKTRLLIFIHGDGSRGGASDYLYPLAGSFAADGVVSVGLIRPGYYDSENNHSTGFSYRSEGDGYRPEIIDAVAQAVKVLKAHYNAGHVVLVGHSGGAAISGVITGKYPGLVNAALLGACPCNVPDWRMRRRGRNNWGFSLSPHDFVDAVHEGTRIIAMTGSDDSNTYPDLARAHVKSLAARGIDARYIVVPEASHNGVARSGEFKSAIKQLLAP